MHMFDMTHSYVRHLTAEAPSSAPETSNASAAAAATGFCDSIFEIYTRFAKKDTRTQNMHTHT